MFSRDKTCFNCTKVGHISRACKAPRRKKQTVAMVTENHLEEDTHVLNLRGNGTQCIRIKCKMDNVPVSLIADSGAGVSVLSKRTFDKLPAKTQKTLRKAKMNLTAYGGTIVNVVGKVTVLVDHKGRLDTMDFIVAHGAVDIIGMDKFGCFGIAINTDNEIRHLSQASSDKYIDVLKFRYAPVFQNLGKAVNFVHKVKINPEIQPVTQRLRRIPISKQAGVKAELESLLKQDIIERTEASEWVSNIVAVEKTDGSLRICVDLRAANKAVIPDKYPTMTIDELAAATSGAKIFSKIDLRKGYLQIPLHPDSRDLTTFITEDGLFRFKRVSFGLASEAGVLND